jgi:uncharacterized delta-60 repeat protein
LVSATKHERNFDSAIRFDKRQACSGGFLAVAKGEKKMNYRSIILAIGLFLALSVSIPAAPGDLDPTFGNGGKVITPGIGGISDIAIQPDGKIVAVGGARIVRYDANGSLDSSFGTGGIVIIQLGTGIAVYANSVAIQPDGKIVVAAESEDFPGGQVPGFAVVRCNPNGTLDTTFGGTGIVSLGFAGGGDSVAIQPDGKIVVCGGDFISYVHRFNPNGALDTSFNGTGSIITPNSSASSVALQPDGKIIVGGSERYSGDTFYDRIFRYNADGSPDTSFGDAGSASNYLDGVWWSHIHKIVIQSDGTIVAKIAGEENTDFDLRIPFTLTARFNQNGMLVYETIHLNAGDVAIQPDGKIVSVSTNLYGSDFAVRRYNLYGFRDATFSEGGLVTTDFGDGDEAFAVAIQADGKIVAAGVVDSHFALARYEGGSRTRFDFDGDGKADVSVFRPSDRIWYLDQSTNGFSATQWGLSTDKLTPADYDGDGRTDISIYRDGIWYWLNSSDNSFNMLQFGLPNDIPVPADYFSGGGRSELAVFRNGTWWILNLFDNQVRTIQFGIASDKPVPADYDGDGRADQAIYRDGEWHLNRSAQGYTVANFGLATDKPIAADYDGDGKTDVAVYRDGAWYLLQSTNGFAAFSWGIASDILAPADYDGDGKTDAAVFRNGVWYLLQSTSGFSIQQFGLANDKPVPAAYLP